MRVILTHAAIAAAPLDAAKQWLAISGPRDDALLTDLLASALRICETFIGSFPLLTTLREDLAASTQWQSFVSHPVTAITGVEAVGTDNSRRPLGPGDYTIETAFDGTAAIRLATPIPEPHIAMTMEVGLAADWATLDPALRQGIIRLAAHYYRERDYHERESGARGSLSASAPPAAVAALWQPWRRLRL